MISLEQEFIQAWKKGWVFCEGTTEFFRHPKQLQILVDYALSKPSGTLTKFLFAPSSIGCEPYSFAMMAGKAGVFERHPDLHLYGLDVSEKFLGIATKAAYPVMLGHRRVVRRGYEDAIELHPETNNMFRMVEGIRSRVTFLPPQDIREHVPDGGRYDATTCLNLLLHLSQANDCEERRGVYEHLASITEGLLCVNDAESVDRKEVTRLMQKRKMAFVRLQDHFDGAAKPVHKKASEAVFHELLGYHECDDSMSRICIIQHRR